MEQFYSDLSYVVAHPGHYPYFGPVGRLSGPASTYGMFAMLLLPGALWSWRDYRAGRWPLWPFLIIFAAVFFTLGKELLLLLMGMVWLSGWGTVRVRWALVSGLALFLLLVTHWMPVRTDNAVEQTEYVSDRVAWRPADRLLVLETNYMAHKRAAFLIGAAHPWLGVGPGRFREHTEALKASGDYPQHLHRFDPHGAWTGAFAETGSLGFLALLALVASLWYYRLPQGTGAGWSASIGLLLLLFLLASLFKDVMNFRGLWLLVGLLPWPPRLGD